MNTNMKELTLDELEQVSGGSYKAIGANTIMAYQNNRAKGDNPVKAALLAVVDGFIKGTGKKGDEL